MNYVNFFGHSVSKLIVGDNPMTGHSYITKFVTGEEMLAYYNESTIIETIFKMEELGINTMLPLADPYVIRVLQNYRRAGGKMHFIFQTYSPLDVDVSMRLMSKVEPIGLYLSGSYVDVRYETGRNQEIFDRLEKLREMGIPLGMGTHRPEVVEESERDGWGADFYMACMYNLRRHREGEESGFLTGKDKSRVVAIPEDRPVMLNTLKSVKKPVIAFKIFAGGQMLVNKTEAERRAAIKETYDTIFTALKPDDFAVMGVFQKHHDQLAENVSVFNEWVTQKDGVSV